MLASFYAAGSSFAHAEDDHQVLFFLGHLRCLRLHHIAEHECAYLRILCLSWSCFGSDFMGRVKVRRPWASNTKQLQVSLATACGWPSTRRKVLPRDAKQVLQQLRCLLDPGMQGTHRRNMASPHFAVLVVSRSGCDTRPTDWNCSFMLVLPQEPMRQPPVRFLALRS